MSLTVTTMVYDDVDFLPIWKRYWLERLPAASLYVIVHGGGEEMMDLAEGTTRIPMARPASYKNMEVDRWKMLSAFVSGLAYMNDVVVYTDVDEILIADPAKEPDIVKCLSETTAPVNTAMGLELIHHSTLEPGTLNLDLPVLQQRRHVRASNFYAKPCIVRAPVNWGRGGHFADYEDIAFVDGVFNLHLRFMDDTLFLKRARRRRNTTATNLKINATARRKWRVSDDAAEALLAQHRDYPIDADEGKLPSTWSMRRPMLKRSKIVEKTGVKMRHFPFREAKTLSVLPDRFADLV